MLTGLVQVYSGVTFRQLFGKFTVSIFGIFAALAVFLFFILSSFDNRRKKLLDFEAHLSIATWMVFAAVIGARLLDVAMDWQYFASCPAQILRVWDGGLSLLGGIVGAIVAGLWQTFSYRINFLDYADLVSIYAPLLQAIARMGCFFVGCCYGCPALVDAAFAVVYKNPASWAPCNVALCPVQLYSVALSLGIFVLLFAVSRAVNVKRGGLFFAYLTLEGLARGAMDFWRGDRECIAALSGLLPWGGITVSQLLAFVLAIVGLCGLFWVFLISRSTQLSSE